VLFRASREDRKGDRWLDLRLLLFVVGAAFAMIAIMLDIAWLVWVAIAVLFAGMILGLVRRRIATEND